MVKRQLLVLFTAFGLFLPFTHPLHAADWKTDRSHPTGLIFDQKEADKIRKEWKRIQKVNHSKLGLERVNAELKKRGKATLPLTTAVLPGQETVSAVDTSTPKAAAPFFASPNTTTSTNSINASDRTEPANTTANPAILPVSIDNSETIWFPPIGDQGYLGSCLPFATTYYQLSFAEAINKNIAINKGDLTHIYSPKFTYNLNNLGDGNLGTHRWYVYATLELLGAPAWSEFPYDNNAREWPTRTQIWRNAINSRINPVEYVNLLDTDNGLIQLKQLINNGYLAVFGTDIYAWHYDTIKDNPSVTDDNSFVGQAIASYVTREPHSGHAMTIVGYNDSIWTDINGNGRTDPGELGALKIANQWGTSWGNKGFIWLAYDALREIPQVIGAPTITRTNAFWGASAYIIRIKANYTPKLIGEVTLNQAQRDQVQITIGLLDTTGEPSIARYVGINYAGGPYTYDGRITTSCPSNCNANDPCASLCTERQPSPPYCSDLFCVQQCSGANTQQCPSFCNMNMFDYNQCTQCPYYCNPSNSCYGQCPANPITAVDGNFAFDFTELLPQDATKQRYFLQVEDHSAGFPTILKSFKLIDPSTNALISQIIDTPKQFDNATNLSTIDYTNILKYTMTTSAVNGKITKNPQQPIYNIGTQVALTATPNSGYKFLSWSGDASGKINPLTVTIDKDKTISAVFHTPPTANAGPDQTITLPAQAVLSGTANDDGLPSPLSYTWSLVSGPGTAAFANNKNLSTTVTFSKAGAYALRLTASDGALTATDDIIITVNPQSYTLNVSASGSGNITKSPALSSYSTGTVVSLTATPASGFQFVGWSGDISGSANPIMVTMSRNITITANFVPLSYTLNVSASGSGSITKSPALSSYPAGTMVSLTATPASGFQFVGWSGDVAGSANPIMITVYKNLSVTAIFVPKPNQAPTVNAGPDQSFQFSANLPVYFNATASDDGLPYQVLTYTWSMVSGPGSVNFMNRNAPNTPAIFSNAGVYVVRLSVSDGALTTSDDVTINAIAIPQPNQAPVVNAGPDQTVQYQATLNGTANDDGLPRNSLSISWVKISGPGSVLFDNSSTLITPVMFTAKGTYVLQLTVNDGQLSSSDLIVIRVLSTVQAF